MRIAAHARWRATSVLVVATGIGVIAGSAIPTASADEPKAPMSAEPPKAVSPLDEKNLQLRGLEETIDAGIARRNKLAADIAQLQSDHAKLAAALIAATTTVRDDETAVADAETRLAALDDKQQATRHSLDSRRAIVAEVLAALQRMGRKPPPALLVDPDDVLKAIRTSMLLGAVLPGMRAETDALMADLSDLARTRRAIDAERQRLGADLAALGRERERLSALVDARQVAIGKAQGDMEAERDKAKQLAGEAGSLKELIGRMEQGDSAAAKAAEAARTSDAKLAAMMPDLKANPAPFKDPARLAPAVAFNATKGLLPLPVAGTRLRGFGEDDGLGGTEKGMLVETRAGAVVAAPADAWIAFAGPYRSFGQLVILNAGGGYYIVLAGMERINVDLGQFVLAGEPIAVMGEGSTKSAAAIALGAAQPVLYVEFRKDGATIDPGPWWAKPELQKVRG
jgi:septal ring factor EnvC (AmiA/AmiB activator)